MQGISPYAIPLWDPYGLYYLPPALVLITGYDPLHDEGAAYSAALNDYGVPTETLYYDDMLHGESSNSFHLTCALGMNGIQSP
jgi:acetyl esterase